MNKLYTYPAVFYPDENSISVYFPDLEGCFTFGDDFEDAYEMAKDALSGWLSVYLENNSMPAATALKDLKLKKNEQAMLVEVDGLALKETLNKTIKKTLTIPQWLNIEAEKRGINMSAFLAKSLEKELNL